MIKEKGVVQALSWVLQMLISPIRKRKQHFQIALDGLLYRGGKATQRNKEFLKVLKKAEFIGFATSIQYVLKDGSKDEVGNIWVHPFSTPTLLYKLPNEPALLVTNANIEYNNTILNRIEHNKYSKVLDDVVGKGIKGISG